MRYMIKEDEVLLDEFVTSRNLSHSSKVAYRDAIWVYTEFQGVSMKKLLAEAEMEEEQGIRSKNRKIKTRLLNYRNYLQNNYKKNTVKIRFGTIKTFYRHHDIDLPDLPPLNDRQTINPTPIRYSDLLSKDEIKQALKYTDPLMRALILFMSSSGCARAESLSLTIQDFIDATKEYHNKRDIYDVIHVLKQRDDVVPIFYLTRIKTNKEYYTFCSPEAVEEILNYLLTIETPLTPNTPLFQIHKDSVIIKMMDINKSLQFGEAGGHNRFRTHMLRKFHASSLLNAGFSEAEVDTIQGRSKDSVHRAYFFDDPQKLRQKYIEHMNAVTINLDVNNIDIKSPEYVQLETESQEKDEKIKDYEEIFDKWDETMKNVEEKGKFLDDQLKKMNLMFE